MADLNESPSASESDDVPPGVSQVIIPAGTANAGDGAAAGGNSRLGGGVGEGAEDQAMSANGDANSDVLSPAKYIRIGAMLKQLLEEVRNTPVDAAAHGQLERDLQQLHRRTEVGALADLGEELDALTFDFDGDILPPVRTSLRAGPVGGLAGRSVPRDTGHDGGPADGSTSAA